MEAGSKRKRTTPKFYSVRIGRKPGIYHSWEECRAQIEKHAGAVCESPVNYATGVTKAFVHRARSNNDSVQSFTSFSEAERHLAGTALTKPTKFYAVKSGRTPGIYTDWPSAKAEIDGWAKPRHKAFATRAEAQLFLDEDESVPSKKQKLAFQEGPLGEDGFDRTATIDPTSGDIVNKTPLQSQATKLHSVGLIKDSVIKVYTDGSSRGNGRQGAVAGIGVYFGPRDERNISEPLAGPRQTNQRAELTAIQRALEALPRDTDIEIITDSQYSIKCVTEWSQAWRRNGWKTSAGKAVENKDLVEAILQKQAQREHEGAKTTYTWVKGHAADPGNIAADRLAVDGALASSKEVVRNFPQDESAGDEVNTDAEDS